MRKLALCIVAYLTIAISYNYVMAGATAPNSTNENISNSYRELYNRIDFGDRDAMDYDVFEKAYTGYLNLKKAGKLNNNKSILTVCDMSKSSKEYRLWVIDMHACKVLINDYVAHGQGSGEEFANSFSNQFNSHQSSIGFYVTDDTYIGNHGLSLRLRGMDDGYNNAAYDRDIVVHGAAYVCDRFVANEGRLGRSWGCPAVSEKIAGKLINTIKDGTCLFIYYPQPKYLQASYWLKKRDILEEPDFLASSIRSDTNIVYEYGPLMQEAMQNTKWVKLPLL